MKLFRPLLLIGLLLSNLFSYSQWDQLSDKQLEAKYAELGIRTANEYWWGQSVLASGSNEEHVTKQDQLNALGQPLRTETWAWDSHDFSSKTDEEVLHETRTWKHSGGKVTGCRIFNTKGENVGWMDRSYPAPNQVVEKAYYQTGDRQSTQKFEYDQRGNLINIHIGPSEGALFHLWEVTYNDAGQITKAVQYSMEEFDQIEISVTYDYPTKTSRTCVEKFFMFGETNRYRSTLNEQGWVTEKTVLAGEDEGHVEKTEYNPYGLPTKTTLIGPSGTLLEYRKMEYLKEDGSKL